MRIVYEVIERTIDKYGQILLAPDIEVNTWWTNLGWTDDEIIASYHAHGESEQYHSEIKTDMDIERLPSGKFATNELVLELTIIAYNLLRMIGQESLRHRPNRKRKVKRQAPADSHRHRQHRALCWSCHRARQGYLLSSWTK